MKVGYVIALVCGMLAGQLLFASLHRYRDYIVVLSYRISGEATAQTSVEVKARKIGTNELREVTAEYRKKSVDGNVVVLNVIKLDK